MADKKKHYGTRIIGQDDLFLEIMDPDFRYPYYKGLRFSPLAFILRANYKGREFLYSPQKERKEDIAEGGLAMEFDLGERGAPPGFQEAKLGEPFLKIGVGILKKDTEIYDFKHHYPIVELANNSIDWMADRVIFMQTTEKDAKGYKYKLREEVLLADNQIILNYYFENKGTIPIYTEHYVHNFLCFDNSVSGPDYEVELPFDFQYINKQNEPIHSAFPFPVTRFNNKISFKKLPEDFGHIKFLIKLKDAYIGDNIIYITNKYKGQKLNIYSSLPAVNYAFYVTKEQVSPEVNVLLNIKPGEKIEYVRKYSLQLL